MNTTKELNDYITDAKVLTGLSSWRDGFIILKKPQKLGDELITLYLSNSPSNIGVKVEIVKRTPIVNETTGLMTDKMKLSNRRDYFIKCKSATIEKYRKLALPEFLK